MEEQNINNIDNRSANLTINHITVNQIENSNVIEQNNGGPGKHHFLKSRILIFLIGILLGGGVIGGCFFYYNGLLERQATDSDLTRQLPGPAEDESVYELTDKSSTALAPGVGVVKEFAPTTAYVVNTSTMTIHTPECSAVTEMAYENLEEIEADELEGVEESGYELCKRCLDKEK